MSGDISDQKERVLITPPLKRLELQFMECLKVMVEPKQYSVHCCLRNWKQQW